MGPNIDSSHKEQKHPSGQQGGGDRNIASMMTLTDV